MTANDGIAPGLSPEDRVRVLRGLAEMRRREREGDYRTRPVIAAKMDSMAPWMEVVQPASGPPEPMPEYDENGVELTEQERLADD